jgi:hypothetical protein
LPCYLVLLIFNFQLLLQLPLLLPHRTKHVLLVMLSERVLPASNGRGALIRCLRLECRQHLFALAAALGILDPKVLGAKLLPLHFWRPIIEDKVVII